MDHYIDIENLNFTSEEWVDSSTNNDNYDYYYNYYEDFDEYEKDNPEENYYSKENYKNYNRGLSEDEWADSMDMCSLTDPDNWRADIYCYREDFINNEIKLANTDFKKIFIKNDQSMTNNEQFITFNDWVNICEKKKKQHREPEMFKYPIKNNNHFITFNEWINICEKQNIQPTGLFLVRYSNRPTIAARWGKKNITDFFDMYDKKENISTIFHCEENPEVILPVDKNNSWEIIMGTGRIKSYKNIKIHTAQMKMQENHENLLELHFMMYTYHNCHIGEGIHDFDYCVGDDSYTESKIQIIPYSHTLSQLLLPFFEWVKYHLIPFDIVLVILRKYNHHLIYLENE